MIVANHSNWRTKDLEDLLEGVLGMPGFKEGGHIAVNTVMLFNTSKKKDGKHYTGRVLKPEAAVPTRHPPRWSNTVVVSILTAERLKLEVLDRMAGIRTGCVQDMSQAGVVKVAECIGEAVGSYGAVGLDYSWAKGASLRTRTDNVKRSPELVLNEIDALEAKKRGIEGRARIRAGDIDDKIRLLRRKL